MSIRTPSLSSISIESAERSPKEVSYWRWVALLVGFVILTFPVSVLPFRTGLDYSWMIGLHEVRELELIYGRDIGFIYGPLGHIFYPLNRGDAPTSSTFLLLALYATWWTSVALVTTQLRGNAAVTLFALGTVVSGMMCQQHNAGAVNILLLAAAGFFVRAHVSRQSWWAVPGVIVTAVGLLSKFNIGVACLGSLLAYLALDFLRVGTRRALLQGALLIGLFAAVLTLLFRITNGSMIYLSNYLKTSWLLSAGYSAQMSVSHGREGLLLLLAGGVALGLLIPLLDRRAWRSYATLLLILSLPLFLSYKAAFVRCDDGHVLLTMALLPALLCLMLPAELGRRGTALFRLLIVVVISASLLAMTGPMKLLDMRSPLAGPSNLARLIAWDRERGPLRRSYEAFRDREALSSELQSRIIDDALVDVYPWDISLIAANRLNWAPRYVLQSNVAFHPTLDALGAEHYRSSRAPRFILYRYQACDNQHPCLVDPRTWLEIYRWYDLADVDRPKDLLLLERRSAPRFGEPELIESRTITGSQELVLPRSGEGPWLLEADLELNLLGKLREQLYKVIPPDLRIDYVDGGLRVHRLVWRNLTGGALVSDLPRDLDAATTALAGRRSDRVRSVTFLFRRFAEFKNNIKIKLYKIAYN